MLALRDNFAKSLDQACQEAEKCGGSGTADQSEVDKIQAENQKLQYRIVHMQRAYDRLVDDKSKDEEIERLRTENQKLNYRITHLCKAVDEKEAK